MMLPHLEIAFRFNSYIEKTMPRYLVYEMVKHPNASARLALALAVYYQFKFDLGLASRTVDSSSSISSHLTLLPT
jgi:hypothetical protein